MGLAFVGGAMRCRAVLRRSNFVPPPTGPRLSRNISQVIDSSLMDFAVSGTLDRAQRVPLLSRSGTLQGRFQAVFQRSAKGPGRPTNNNENPPVTTHTVAEPRPQVRLSARTEETISCYNAHRSRATTAREWSLSPIPAGLSTGTDAMIADGGCKTALCANIAGESKIGHARMDADPFATDH